MSMQKNVRERDKLRYKMEAEQNIQKDEIMEVMYKTARKQVNYARISTLAGVVIAVTMIAAALIVVPKTCKLIGQANETLTEASEAISDAKEAIDSIKTMSTGITEVGEKLDTFVENNSTSMETVVNNMESIDFEGLNSAIADLENVVEPLAKFFGVFQK